MRNIRKEAEPPGRSASERRCRYAEARAQLASLLEGESDPVARMASAAALLAEVLPQASFAGFYRAFGDQLVIGPYQGPPACLRIPFGRGVCGTSARENRSLLVADVRTFPGHIACDPLARSELVVPVHDAAGALVAVCDLDSREPGAFDEVDREELEAMMGLLFGRS
jgi:L-methionine (R)-S-oxide reductase